jgi:Tfp pilus assembly protein PilV
MSTQHNTYNNHGFTLLETLVGLTIFMLAFVALAKVNADSLQDIILTKRKITAQYLAEEGIEYVKQIQITAVAQGQSKSDFLNTFVANNCLDGCEFYIGNDTTQYLTSGTGLDELGVFSIPSSGGATSGQIGAAISAAPFDSLAPLKYHTYGLIALDGLYPGNVIADSEYRRYITIKDIPGQDPNQSQAIEVTSTVYYEPINDQTFDFYHPRVTVSLVNIMHFDLP